MDNNNKEKNDEEVNNAIEEVQQEETPQPESEEVIKLKNQIEILQDKLLRSVAEAENTRKRLEKSRDDARDYSIVSFTKDILTVSDNLSRALEYKPQNLEGEAANIVTGVISGVEMTALELAKIFKKHNIELIEPTIGEAFDYNIHNAISQIDSDEYESGSIVAVMQVGYKIKDRLLRPATVQVAK
ncbi:nucleotide exchange factor GrpE [Rickettsia endosymbiont of Polydrusus tereticollis]|uniref:nucleotide exchange factor GrpE n=1 Tax=Rickettsia endosymbiont of Polydrusus tereticollis TaxID=3066251 RepID=UPI00313305DB